MPDPSVQGAVVAALASEVARQLAGPLRRFVVSMPAKFHLHTDGLPQGLAQHIKRYAEWAHTIAIPTIPQDRPHRHLYQELTVTPVRHPESPRKRAQRPYSVSQVIGAPKHVVILGLPGAGKTTSIQHLVNTLLAQGSPFRPFVVVLCRDLQLEGGLPQCGVRALGLKVTPEPEPKPPGKEPDPADLERYRFAQLSALATALDRLDAVLLVDGLDETATDLASSTWRSLDELMAQCTRAKVIVTCRTGAYHGQLTNSLTLQLNDLTPEQIRAIAKSWLSDDDLADQFLRQLEHQRYVGTEVRPLTLIHLCDYFSVRRSLPDKPRTVYHLITTLFCERWDDYRRLKRDTAFTNFDSSTKHDFLQHLAFELAQWGLRGSFTHEALREAYDAVHAAFELPPTAADGVVREIESHTGLVVQAGPEEFEFYHLTVQEYLAGEYLARTRTRSQSLQRLPNELAVAVAISGDPVSFLTEIVMNNLSETSAQHFRTFVYRVFDEHPNWEVDARLGAFLIGWLTQVWRTQGKWEDVLRLKRSMLGGWPVAPGQPQVAESIRRFISIYCGISRSQKHIQRLELHAKGGAANVARALGGDQLVVPNSWTRSHT